MATRSLSQKTIEKPRQKTIDNHRQVVMMLARSAAKKVIKTRLRNQGVRLTLVLPKDINGPAFAYLAEHREQLIAEAEHAITLALPLKAAKGQSGQVVAWFLRLPKARDRMSRRS